MSRPDNNTRTQLVDGVRAGNRVFIGLRQKNRVRLTGGNDGINASTGRSILKVQTKLARLIQRLMCEVMQKQQTANWLFYW